MVEAFACPECGEEVVLEGLAPGRQTLCSGCGILVEVPYLPRVGEGGTRRFRPQRRSRIGKRVIAAFVAGLMVVVISMSAMNLLRSRLGSAARSRLNEVVATVDSAEKAGRLDRALAEIEAAIRLADDPAACDPQCRDALLERRNDLSKREASSRLEQLAQLEPSRAVGEALILRRRVKTDRSLTGMASAVEQALEASRRRWFAIELRAARGAVDDGKLADALVIARRAWTTAADLKESMFQSQVELLVTEIASRSGVVIEPIRGNFFIGSQDLYEKSVIPSVVDALRLRQYLPPPPGADWAALWQTHAPNRVLISINETSEGLYLQSQNRSSRIEFRLRLARKNAPAWEQALNARTGQGPILTNMRAYQAGHLGTSSTRSADAERVLFDDAFQALIEQLGTRLRSLPNPVSS